MHKILRYYDSFPYTINIAETLKHNQRALDTYIGMNGSPGKERNNAAFKNAIMYALIHTTLNNVRNKFKNKMTNTAMLHKERANANTWTNRILQYHLQHERPELTLPHIVFNPLSKPPTRLLMYLAHRELGYLL